jgi:hypothetical protein
MFGIGSSPRLTVVKCYVMSVMEIQIDVGRELTITNSSFAHYSKMWRMKPV